MSATTSPRWARLGLLAILVLDVWLRCHTIGPTVRDRIGLNLWPTTGAEAEPLDCDEAVYGYVGRRLVAGDVLYRDLTEPKPPLGYWLYTLAVALGGANELTIRLVPIPMVLATIVLIDSIGRRLAGPGAGLFAALIYAVASTDPYLFGNGANLEHAMNLFGVGALALFLRALDGHGRASLLAAGACLGAACLVKQVAIVPGIAFAGAIVLRPLAPDRSRPVRDRFLDLGSLAAGFLVVVGAAIAILAIQGAGRSAHEEVIRYGSALATETPAEPSQPPFLVRWLTGNADPEGHLPWPFGATKYLVWWGTGTWPLWASAIPSLGWLLLGPTSVARRLLACWTLSAWFQVAMPGLFWQHYYLLPLPGIALAVAILAADAAVRARPVWRDRFVGPAVPADPDKSRMAGPPTLWRPLVLLLALASFGTAVIQVRDYLLVAPEQLTVRYKGGAQWVTLRGLGRDVRARTIDEPSRRIFVWGWQSPLYFYSGLDGVSRHFFADPLMTRFAGGNHPLIRPRVGRIMSALRTHPPELIFAGNPPFPALRAFLRSGYVPSNLVRVSPSGQGLWVRRDAYQRFETRRTLRRRRPSGSLRGFPGNGGGGPP